MRVYIYFSPINLIKNNELDRYIKSGTGKRAIRKIFYGVKYDNFEQEHIQQLQNLIKSKKVIFPQRFLVEYKLLSKNN